ncbi:MAG TPA: hypothetical protein PK406_15600 [Verrucomicrobiota bacterium]|nr:hypothetical protein [Verrucomicrobiota bacterium]
MTYEQQREEILQEMNTLTSRERGKLCRQSRDPGTTPFFKLQCWQRGKNHTRYVPAQEVPALQEALANHQRFQALAEQFVTLTVGHTRQAAATDRKKNSRRSSPSVTAKPKPS